MSLRIVSPILVKMVRLVQELTILTDTNVSAHPATAESTAKTVGNVKYWPIVGMLS